MLLGLDVRPEYHYAGSGPKLVSRYCQRRAQKDESFSHLSMDEKVKMYEKFGFTDLGQANSTWGGEAWHAMVSRLEDNLTIQNRQESMYNEAYIRNH